MSKKVAIRLAALVVVAAAIVVVALVSRRGQKSGKLEIQMLGGMQGVHNLNERMEGFREAIADPEVELTKVLFNEENPGKSLDDCESALKAHPDLAGFFASNAFGGPGAAGAVEAAIKRGAIRKDQIRVVAFDTTEDILNYIDSGIIHCTLAQNTRNMGKLSIEKLVEFARQYKRDGKFTRPPTGKDIIDTGVIVVWPDDVGKFRTKPSTRKAPLPEGEGVLKFALVPKSIGHPYWEGVREGMEEAAARLNVRAVFHGPPEASADEQLKIIEDFMAKGYDGIGISPNDPTAVKDIIEKAMAKGIAVVTFDSDSPDSERLLYIGTDNREAGRVAGRAMRKLLGLSEAGEEK